MGDVSPPPGSQYPAGHPGDQPPPFSVYPPPGMVPLPGFAVPPLGFPPQLPPLGPDVREAEASPETPPKEAG